jgi:hypothetical protein
MSGDVKLARDTGDEIGIVQRTILRTKLLRYLDHIYPKRIARPVLRAALCETKSKASLREADSEIEYLIEKRMITLKRGKRLRISPRGRDFLDGHIEEAGLADPVLVH